MVYAIVFVLLVLIDQISKAVAFAVWGCPSGLSYFLGNFLGIDTLVNTGISGGIGSDRPWALPVFIAVTCVALVALLVVLVRLNKKRRLLRTSVVLIMAGAAGNLIDRCVTHGVRDFLHWNFAFWSFSNNFADLVITVGAVLFIVAILFVDSDALFRSHKKKEAEQAEVREAAEELASAEGEKDGDKQ